MSVMLRTCPHCEAVMVPANMARHIVSCLHNPTVLEPVHVFLQETAQDGYVMPGKQYTEISGPLGLPSARTLRDHFGGWRQVAEWVGLNYREGRGKGPAHGAALGKRALNAPIESIGPDPEKSYAEGMNVYKALRYLRSWCPRTHRYFVTHVQTVYAVR